MTQITSHLIGSGAFLPAQCVSNDDLAARGIDTNDEWIRTRTGIAQRHIVAEGEHSSDLAAAAAHAALEDGGIDVETLDGIIVATSTPDTTMPATAVHVQAKIGAPSHAFAFDMSAACSGFVYGLSVADSLLKAGQAKRILLIGAETMSRIVNWEDRGTCVLFGDGAGAWVLEAREDVGGVLAHVTHSDGGLISALNTTGGVSSTKEAGVLTMNGGEVFRHAVSKMADAVAECCDAAKVAPSEIDWLIPHQANQRILASVGNKLGVSADKLISTVDKHANTSAASVPLAFAQAKAEGKIQPGQLIAMPVLGAGLVWGCSLMRL